MKLNPHNNLAVATPRIHMLRSSSSCRTCVRTSLSIYSTLRSKYYYLCIFQWVNGNRIFAYIWINEKLWRTFRKHTITANETEINKKKECVFFWHADRSTFQMESNLVYPNSYSMQHIRRLTVLRSFLSKTCSKKFPSVLRYSSPYLHKIYYLSMRNSSGSQTSHQGT